jgi:hypothetical protein
MDLAETFFVERGHQVVETFVERGYDPEEEVKNTRRLTWSSSNSGELVLCALDLQNTWTGFSMSAWPRTSCSSRWPHTPGPQPAVWHGPQNAGK